MIKTAISQWALVLSCVSVAFVGTLTGCKDSTEADVLAKARFGRVAAVAKDDAVAYLYMSPKQMTVLPGNRKGDGQGTLHVEITGPNDHSPHTFDLHPLVIEGVNANQSVLAARLEHADVVWWATNFPRGWSDKASLSFHFDNQFTLAKGAKRGILDWMIAVRNGKKIDSGAIENEFGKHMYTPVNL